jgi:hypothetical protein
MPSVVAAKLTITPGGIPGIGWVSEIVPALDEVVTALPDCKLSVRVPWILTPVLAGKPDPVIVNTAVPGPPDTDTLISPACAWEARAEVAARTSSAREPKTSLCGMMHS